MHACFCYKNIVHIIKEMEAIASSHLDLVLGSFAVVCTRLHCA